MRGVRSQFLKPYPPPPPPHAGTKFAISESHIEANTLKEITNPQGPISRKSR